MNSFVELLLHYVKLEIKGKNSILKLLNLAEKYLIVFIICRSPVGSSSAIFGELFCRLERWEGLFRAPSAFRLKETCPTFRGNLLKFCGYYFSL